MEADIEAETRGPEISEILISKGMILIGDTASSSDDTGLVSDLLEDYTEYSGTVAVEAAENKANDLVGEAEECLEEAREAAYEAANSLARENDGEAVDMAEITGIAAKAANEVLAQAEGLAVDYPDSESIKEAVGEIRKCAAQAVKYAQMASKAISADN
jgi:hypothetical protein